MNIGIVIGGMTVSIDGFVNDRNGDVGRLYPDLAALRETEILQESMQKTGAVVMGRRTYEMAANPDWYVDQYEYQVPIFVLTHHVPEKMPKQSEKLTFTFVTDGIESAVAKAKAAANGKNVTIVGGASTIQQCLQAGLLDELEIGIMPVLFGGGVRLFEHLPPDQIKLEKLRLIESPAGRTDMIFRVVR